MEKKAAYAANVDGTTERVMNTPESTAPSLPQSPVQGKRLVIPLDAKNPDGTPVFRRLPRLVAIAERRLAQGGER